jgi:hypothetical protein
MTRCRFAGRDRGGYRRRARARLGRAQLSALKCRLTLPRSACQPILSPNPRRAPLSERSECVSGHPSTGPESIYVDGKGAQRCAGCRRGQRREYARRHRERRKATAPPRFCFEPGCPNTLSARSRPAATRCLSCAAAARRHPAASGRPPRRPHANARRVIRPDIDQSCHPMQLRSAARGHVSYRFRGALLQLTVMRIARGFARLPAASSAVMRARYCPGARALPRIEPSNRTLFRPTTP